MGVGGVLGEGEVGGVLGEGGWGQVVSFNLQSYQLRLNIFYSIPCIISMILQSKVCL